MTYTADSGAISATFHPGAQAAQAATGPGTISRFLAPGSATQGRFGLFEFRMAVVTVPGASPAAFIAFTQVSIWERRIAFIGTLENVVEPAASFIASTVPGTHTCRADQQDPPSRRRRWSADGGAGLARPGQQRPPL